MATKCSHILALFLISATLLLVLLPINSDPVTAQNDKTSNWKTLTVMPTLRGDFGVAVVAGRIYVIGGVNENNYPLGTVEEYNPITDVWTNKMSMLTPRTGLAVAVYNNKIYTIGGAVNGEFVGNNEVYDPATNGWSIKASMTIPRADLSATVVNDVIYLIGGKESSSVNPYYVDTGINECYFPQNDSWSQKPQLPISVFSYGSAVRENKIYILGGERHQATSGTWKLVDNNQVYDVQTETWTVGAPLPVATSDGAATSTTGTFAPKAIYLLGGVNSTEQTISNTVMMYHLSNNSWTKVESMPTAREHFGVAVIGDILYALGGFDGANWLSTLEQYTPVGYGTIPPIIELISPMNKTVQQVILDFTLNREAQWTGYSLDGQTNNTVTGQTKLFNLAQGGHRLVMFANDSSGNMGASNTVYFSVDTVGPQIVILFPTNQSYASTDIQLEFTLSENASLVYVLDDRQPNSIVGNITLVALSEGSHHVSLYATDNLGNTTEQKVYFNIVSFPFLTIIAILAVATIIGATVFILNKKRKSKKDNTN